MNEGQFIIADVKLVLEHPLGICTPVHLGTQQELETVEVLLTSELGAEWGLGTLRMGGPVSLSFRQPNGELIVAYHFDAGERDYVLACVLTPWLPDGSRSEVPWPSEPFEANWAIQPIVDTFQILLVEG